MGIYQTHEKGIWDCVSNSKLMQLCIMTRNHEVWRIRYGPWGLLRSNQALISEASPSHTISHFTGQLWLQRCQIETDPHCDLDTRGLRQDTEQDDCANSQAVTRGSEFPTDDPFNNLTIVVGQNAQKRLIYTWVSFFLRPIQVLETFLHKQNQIKEGENWVPN